MTRITLLNCVRFNLKQVDLYGEERNGTFDGLVGRMQRGELEVGITSMFMRADRWRVVHYSAETVELKSVHQNQCQLCIIYSNNTLILIVIILSQIL